MDTGSVWLSVRKVFVQVSDTQNRYSIYLVTNRPVIEEHAATNGVPLWVKFNLEAAGASKEYEIQLKTADGKTIWHAHPNSAIDVAIIPIDGPFLKGEGARFALFQSDHDVLTRKKAKEIGLSEGDGAYVLGFPMGRTC